MSKMTPPLLPGEPRADSDVESSPELNWEAVREDFLVQNLDPTRDRVYTYRACAKMWGVHRTTVERHARAEGWRDELRLRAKIQAEASINKHQETFTEIEAEIRDRHATINKGMIAKAIAKLQSITDPAHDLSVDQMIKLLQLAMPGEREARGLSKHLTVNTLSATGANRGFETPTQKIERVRTERNVRDRLVAVLAGGGVEMPEEELLEAEDESAP